jgi:tetratricopeptide (TPR) repeat protein
LTATGDDRVRDLLEIGEQLLTAGRGREASDAFGRILLLNPDDAAARQGLDRARVVAAEQARQLDACIDEARAALEAGERQTARRLLEEVVERGGDRDRALGLLERLAERDGRLEPPRRDLEAPTPAPAAPLRLRFAWSRRAFLLGCAAFFAVLAAGVAASWDVFVEELVRRPSPQQPHAESVARDEGAR